MDYLVCESRCWEHFRAAEDVNRHGWKQSSYALHGYRTILAKALVALAALLAPSMHQQDCEAGDVRTATA